MSIRSRVGTGSKIHAYATPHNHLIRICMILFYFLLSQSSCVFFPSCVSLLLLIVDSHFAQSDCIQTKAYALLALYSKQNNEVKTTHGREKKMFVRKCFTFSVCREWIGQPNERRKNEMKACSSFYKRIIQMKWYRMRSRAMVQTCAHFKICQVKRSKCRKQSSLVALFLPR